MKFVWSELGFDVTIAHYLILSAVLLTISVMGMVINRRNLIAFLMCIELMLLATNLNFVAFSFFLSDWAGQVFVFFVLTIAAAEAAIGLAILVLMFRRVNSIDAQDLNLLKG